MWADDPRVAGAYLTAFTSGEKSAAALRFSLDVLEENAHRMPLDCDRAFARLADIARACSLQMIEKRAAERSAYYCGIRTAAAAGCGSALTYA